MKWYILKFCKIGSLIELGEKVSRVKLHQIGRELRVEKRHFDHAARGFIDWDGQSRGSYWENAKDTAVCQYRLVSL
jgi:hypothetical protein